MQNVVRPFLEVQEATERGQYLYLDVHMRVSLRFSDWTHIWVENRLVFRRGKGSGDFTALVRLLIPENKVVKVTVLFSGGKTETEDLSYQGSMTVRGTQDLELFVTKNLDFYLRQLQDLDPTRAASPASQVEPVDHEAMTVVNEPTQVQLAPGSDDPTVYSRRPRPSWIWRNSLQDVRNFGLLRAVLYFGRSIIVNFLVQLRWYFWDSLK